MNLGDAPSWAIALGILTAVSAVVAAVWKLAREASGLQIAMNTLATSQTALALQLKEHIVCFTAYQREQAAVQREQATAIQELRLAMERLTWEVAHLKGE